MIRQELIGDGFVGGFSGVMWYRTDSNSYLIELGAIANATVL